MTDVARFPDQVRSKRPPRAQSQPSTRQNTASRRGSSDSARTPAVERTCLALTSTAEEEHKSSRSCTRNLPQLKAATSGKGPADCRFKDRGAAAVTLRAGFRKAKQRQPETNPLNETQKPGKSCAGLRKLFEGGIYTCTDSETSRRVRERPPRCLSNRISKWPGQLHALAT